MKVGKTIPLLRTSIDLAEEVDQIEIHWTLMVEQEQAGWWLEEPQMERMVVEKQLQV